jgi:hypothetical protein
MKDEYALNLFTVSNVLKLAQYGSDEPVGFGVTGSRPEVPVPPEGWERERIDAALMIRHFRYN